MVPNFSITFFTNCAYVNNNIVDIVDNPVYN